MKYDKAYIVEPRLKIAIFSHDTPVSLYISRKIFLTLYIHWYLRSSGYGELLARILNRWSRR